MRQCYNMNFFTLYNIPQITWHRYRNVVCTYSTVYQNVVATAAVRFT